MTECLQPWVPALKTKNLSETLCNDDGMDHWDHCRFVGTLDQCLMSPVFLKGVGIALVFAVVKTDAGSLLKN